MWKDNDVYVTIKGFAVRVKDERQNDRNHLVEVTFETPLTYDLADQILPAMARDLFDKHQNAKAEMKDATFNVDVQKQILTVRLVPGDDTGIMRVPGVALRDIAATKTEANTWALQFKMNFTLGSDDREAILFIRQLKQGVYLSMERQQMDLLAQEGQADKERGTGGEVTDMATRKPRKRKTTPENEAAAQEQDAAARTDDQATDEPTPPATH